MVKETLFLTILAMAVVTYLPRLLPVWLLSRRSLPPLFIAWLRFVPPAVLAAMLLPGLLAPSGQLFLSRNNLILWASVPTLAVAMRTRSMLAAVLCGLAFVAAGRAWLAL